MFLSANSSRVSMPVLERKQGTATRLKAVTQRGKRLSCFIAFSSAQRDALREEWLTARPQRHPITAWQFVRPGCTGTNSEKRTTPNTSRTRLNHWFCVTEKESDQIALPPNARFREDAFDLRPHRVVGYTDRIRYLLWRMAIAQQQCHATFGGSQTEALVQDCHAWPLGTQRIRNKDNYRRMAGVVPE